MPEVTVRSSPNGLPIATTGSPTLIWSESPRGQRRQRPRAGVDLEHRQVAGRIGADDGGLQARAVREADAHLLRAVDDVEVRDDVTRLVDDEARAERLLALLLREERVAEERVGRDVDDRRRRHLDDARCRPLVDVVDRGTGPVDGGRGRGCGRRRGLDLANRRRLAEVAEEGGAAERKAGAEDRRRQQPTGTHEDAIASCHRLPYIRPVLTLDSAFVKAVLSAVGRSRTAG